MTAYADLVGGPIDTPALVARVAEKTSGAVVVFEGRTRSPNRARVVCRLVYEAFAERARNQLEALACRALSRPGVRGVALVHRTGEVPVGETSVVVVVAAEHRGPAFEVARELIDRIKAEVAIWKKEIFVDGEEWAEPAP